MSNEYPPRPTQMCEPVINGTNVVSDVCDYFINKLKKAIDEYWQSKYKTYAKGRIKRIKSLIPKHRCPSIYKRIGRKRYIAILNMNGIVFEKTMFGITRWNRH